MVLQEVIQAKTDSMFSRYNAGKEKGVEEARRAIEQFHRNTQKKQAK